MLVLDFVRQTAAKKPSIRVPRIHAGHLGFLPGTRVFVSRPTTGSAHSGVEVLVTPFETDTENTALISVVLHDAIGVVRSLVQALSWLNINIEVLESSSIDHLNLHRVGMIVDLSGMRKDGETPMRVQDEYRPYAANVPLHSRRYLEIFDRIVAQCGDALWWHPYEEIGGRPFIPSLYVRPLYRSAARNLSDLVLGEPAADDTQTGRYTEIELPPSVRKHICDELCPGAESGDELSYVFVSDTNDRTLRACFLPRSVASRLVHVGLYHSDRAGTLGRVLDAVAAAQFNIVTSLLRKHSEGKSVWEAVLRYEGEDEQPPTMPASGDALPQWYRDELLPWVCGRLRASSRFRELNGCDVSIGPPRYPKRYGGDEEDNVLTLSEDDERTQDSPQITNQNILTLLDQRYRNLILAERSPPEALAGGELIRTVALHRIRTERRTLFLSYPKTASKYVSNYLWPELEPAKEWPTYLLTHLQEKRPLHPDPQWASIYGDNPLYDLMQRRKQLDADDIQEEAVALIRDADYFLAIWHPEEDKEGHRYSLDRISPWMFFEYGVARALRKPCVIACHQQIKATLDPVRLVGLKNLVVYDDTDFAKKVDEIRARCTITFDDTREALFNHDRLDNA